MKGFDSVFELADGRQVYFRVEQSESAEAFDEESNQIGQVELSPLGEEEGEFLVTHVSVVDAFQRNGIATEMIGAFCDSTDGAKVYFCVDASSSKEDAGHLTGPGRALAESMIREGLAYRL